MAVGAFVMRNISATFDTTQFAEHLSKAELEPEVEVAQLKLLGGNTVSDVDEASWMFNIAGVQDWKVSQGLADFLNTNHGQEIDVVLQPRLGAGERVATFKCIGRTVKFGGEQGNFNLMEVSLPVVGKPTYSTAV